MYTVLAVHPAEPSCLAPGAGITVLHSNGACYDLLIRECRPRHALKLVKQ